MSSCILLSHTNHVWIGEVCSTQSKLLYDQLPGQSLEDLD